VSYASKLLDDLVSIDMAGKPAQGRVTANSCQVPSIPFKGWAPRSCKTTSEPTIKSRTVLDARISPGLAAASTRAAM